MQFAPAYKLTLCKPRSEDPTESAPLTQRDDPAEQFVVSTLASAGRPVLARPRGRRGRIDLIRRKVDTGEITVRVLDQGIGTDRLHRWVTSFLGDEQGRARFLRLRAEVLESVDGGETWTPYLTGRVWRPALKSKLWWEFILRDTVDELDTEIFVGPPGGEAALYAQPSPVLPADGLLEEYAGFRPVKWLRGKVSYITTAAFGGRMVTIDKRDQDGIRNKRTLAFDEVTYGGRQEMPHPEPRQGIKDYLLVGRDVRARVRIAKSTSAPGRVGESGDFWIGDIGGRGSLARLGESGVVAVSLQALIDTEPRYMAWPSVGDEVEWYLYRHARPTPAAPLLIDDVHLITLLRLVLDGWFGPLTDDGEPKVRTPYDTALMSALEADPSWPKVRLVITESYQAREFIERYLCRPYPLAYRISPSGEFTPIDLRLPASFAGVPLLNEGDVAREQDGTLWEHDPSGAVSSLVVHHYFDRYRQEEGKQSKGPNLREPSSDERPSGLMPEIKASIEYLFDSYGDLSERAEEIDAIGLRATASGSTNSLRSPEWVRGIADAAAAFYRTHFARGLITAPIKCRRTPSVMSCYEGDLRIIEVPWLPDPASNRRGGARVVRCIERSPDGPHITLRVVDLGESTVSVSPTIGIVSRSLEEPRHAVDVPITLNAAGESVVIQTAVTAQSVSVRPAAGDSRWSEAARVSGSGTRAIGRLPSRSRVWVRARTEAVSQEGPKLPSAWIYAGAYVDTEALPAPTVASASEVTRSTALLRWTLGDDDLGIEVLLTLGGNPAAWTSADVIAALSAGSIRYPLRGLDGPTVQHTAGVRHIDPYGGSSAVARVTFSTTTTFPQAPRPAGISLAGGA